MNVAQQFRLFYQPLVFSACALPAALMAAGIAGVGPMDLGADPVARLIHASGITTLNLLLITLLVTPVRQMTGWSDVVRLRRMLGLFAFCYALLHFTCYAWLDQDINLRTIGADIVKRPYITIGMLALLMLVPLATTSTAAMMRRLGRRWTRLHRLVYVITALGVWHFWWQVKRDIREPLLYVCLFAALMAWRVGWQLRARSAPARVPGRT